MASASLTRRVIRLPLTVSTNQQAMAGILSQVLPLVYADASGVLGWYENFYNIQTNENITHVELMLLPANDATLMAMLPALLSSLGLSFVQTYSEQVVYGY